MTKTEKKINKKKDRLLSNQETSPFGESLPASFDPPFGPDMVLVHEIIDLLYRESQAGTKVWSMVKSSST